MLNPYTICVIGFLLIVGSPVVSATQSAESTTLVQHAYNGDLEAIKDDLKSGIDPNAEGNNGFTPLIAASINAQYKAVELLLDAGADAERDHDSLTPLWAAAFSGSSDIVSRLLLSGASPSGKLYRGHTPFQIAVKKGHEKVALVLVDKVTEWNQGLEGITPLMYASALNMRLLAVRLLDKGANVNSTATGMIRDKYGLPVEKRTALMFASLEGHEALVSLLLDNGADIAAVDSLYNTAFDLAVEKDRISVVRLLLSRLGQLPTCYLSKGQGQSTDLLMMISNAFESAAAGDVAAVQRLIQQEPDVVSVRNCHKKTLAEVAAQAGRINILESLSDAGIGLDQSLLITLSTSQRQAAIWLMKAGQRIPDTHGWSYSITRTFTEAIEAGDNDFVAAALNSGWNPNQQLDYYPTCPLNIAIGKNHKETVELLLANGADPNQQAVGCDRALIYSDLNSNLEISRILVRNGARYKEEDLWRVTERYLDAAKTGDIEQVELFLKAGVTVDLADYNNRTALSFAAENLHQEVVKRLIKAGADLSVQDTNNFTPLHYASLSSPEIVKLLLQAGAEPNGSQGPSTVTTPLMIAARHGVAESAAALIDMGAQVDLQDQYGKTALQLAIQEGHLSVAVLLLNAKADPNLPDNHGVVPLMEAIRSNDESMVERLLASGARTDIQDQNGRDVMRLAYEHKTPALFRWLANGSKPAWLESRCLEELEKAHYDKIHFCAEAGLMQWSLPFRQKSLLAVAYGAPETLLQFLVSTGADFNAADNEGYTVLMKACQANPAVVPYLLSLNPDVNAKNSFGSTVLTFVFASGYDNKEAKTQRLKNARLLLAHPEFRPSERELERLWMSTIELDASDFMSELLEQATQGQPSLGAMIRPFTAVEGALYHAIESDSRKTMALFMGLGLRLTADEGGKALPKLFQTIAMKEWQYVESLISAGVEINGYGETGLTPTMTASMVGYIPLLEQLVTSGAVLGLTSQDGRGRTALMLAVEAGNAPVVQYLLHAGADVDQRSAEGKGLTALMLAVANGNDDIVEHLLASGADPSLRDASGRMISTMLPAKGSGVLRKRLAQAIKNARDTELRPNLAWSAEGYRFVNSAALSDDGRLLLLVSHRSIRLLEASSGRLIRTFENGTTPVWDMRFRFLHGNKAVIGMSDQNIEVWSSETGKLLFNNLFDEPQSGEKYRYLASVTAPGASKVVTAATLSGTQYLLHWDAVTGKLLRRWIVDSSVDSIVSLDISVKSSRLASLGRNGEVRVWDLSSKQGQSRLLPRMLANDTGAIPHYSHILSSLDGHTVAADGYEFFDLWDPITKQRLIRLDDPGHVGGELLSDDGRYFFFRGRVWDRTTGILSSNLLISAHEIATDEHGLTFSPDGQLLVVADGQRPGTVRFWSMPETGLERTLHFDDVSWSRLLALSHDNEWLALAGGRLQIVNARTGETRWQTDVDEISRLVFSRRGDVLVTEHFGNTLNVWDSISGTLLKTIEGSKIRLQGNSVLFARGESLFRLNTSDLGVEPAGFQPPNWRDWFPANDQGHMLALTDSGITLLDSAGRKQGTSMLPERDKPLSVSRIALSDDGNYIAVDRPDGGVAILDTKTGGVLAHRSGEYTHTEALVFAPQNRLVVATSNGAIKTWEPVTGQWSDTLPPARDSRARVVISRLGANAFLYGGTVVEPLAARYVDLQSGHLSQYTPMESSLTSASLSDDNAILASSTGNTIELFNLVTGRNDAGMRAGSLEFSAAKISPDAKLVAAENGTGVFVWVTANKILKARLNRCVRPQFTNDTRYLVAWEATGKSHYAGPDQKAEQTIKNGGMAVLSDSFRAVVWDVALSRVVGKYDSLYTWKDGEHLALAGGMMLSHIDGDDSLALWRPQTGEVVRRYPGDLIALSRAADDRHFVAARDGVVVVVEIASGQIVRTFTEHMRYSRNAKVVLTAMSSDGRWLASKDRDGTILVRGMPSGSIKYRLAGEGGFGQTNLIFLKNNRFLMSANVGGARHFWNLDDGHEAATLLSFNNGSWIVSDPQGRYDSNHPGNVEGMSWVFPDDPLAPLPVEIFMQAYYEPGLLGRILEGEKFNQVPRLADLNRVQPRVEVASVESSAKGPSYVDVTVNVSRAEKEFKRNGKSVRQISNVHDLRLFRNGQLVRYAPGTDGTVSLNKAGKASLVFRDIPLPSHQVGTVVDFSAYAFNQDRVKSRTATLTYHAAEPLETRPRSAYIVTIGVNAYENPSWNLRYAVNDAATHAKLLSQRLKESGEYHRVVTVPLLADVQGADGGRALASKRVIEAVITRLAGKQVDSTLLADVPNAGELREVTPDDLVIITFSGHGFASTNGRFHFFPYDIGKGNARVVDDAFLARTLSSDNLATWLRDVDAGDMVMVIDACNSAASVAGQGFKPGPMGSRGLGQLAYDKGVRVLAASQAEQVAFEDDKLQHGMLTYALANEGLAIGRADYLPADGMIDVAEWLHFGATRVPELYTSIKKGSWMPEAGARGQLVFSGEGRKQVEEQAAFAQRPVLFDFSGRAESPVLVRRGQKLEAAGR